MSNAVKAPKTLLEAAAHFADGRKAFEYIRDRRFPNGVACPRCSCERVHCIETRMPWRRNGCRRQFSVRVGTIFEDSPIRFSKWLPATWLLTNAKDGIGSCELARSSGVTQKAAWFMLRRLRLLMQNGTVQKLGDHVEADEAHIGGKARNVPAHKREARIKGRGSVGKSIVVGMLERGGEVVTMRVGQADRRTLQGIAKAGVHKGGKLCTDAHKGYTGLVAEYAHKVVDHAVTYVVGTVHTNGLENHWTS